MEEEEPVKSRQTGSRPDTGFFGLIAGTVSAVETRPFHRQAQYSPGSQCYHWNNNCESYWRVGQAMGKSMLKLIK